MRMTAYMALATAVFLLSAPAAAQVYKCTQNGKSVFTDRPCDDATQQINVRPAAGYHSSAGAPASAAQSAAEDSTLNDMVDRADRMARQRGMQNEIDQKEARISTLEMQRDNELNRLRNQKGHANNNLAGATWLQSISQEMSAVIERYNGEIQMLRSDIERLRRERVALD